MGEGFLDPAILADSVGELKALMKNFLKQGCSGHGWLQAVDLKKGSEKGKGCGVRPASSARAWCWTVHLEGILSCAQLSSLQSATLSRKLTRPRSCDLRSVACASAQRFHSFELSSQVTGMAEIEGHSAIADSLLKSPPSKKGAKAVSSMT